RGGIYDQVGGGFHRYSVDAHWLVPHFEKMLYDNGQLASLYLHGWLAFGDPECRRVCEETLDYILREMTDPAGGFYSSQDADSEGHEGKFFVWTPDELREVLGDADAELVLKAMRADGRLLRTWKSGRAKLKGYLEDYAMVAVALLDVYEATFERRWLDEARTLSDEMIRLFWDEQLDGFYDTGSDGE